MTQLVIASATGADQKTITEQSVELPTARLIGICLVGSIGSNPSGGRR
jgi:hypothetical protein